MRKNSLDEFYKNQKTPIQFFFFYNKTKSTEDNERVNSRKYPLSEIFYHNYCDVGGSCIIINKRSLRKIPLR